MPRRIANRQMADHLGGLRHQNRGFPAPESGFNVPGPAAGPLLAIGGLRLLYRAPSAISANGFVNVDITGVTYISSGDDGNYTYPKTINGVRYTDKKDFLTRYPTSTWNVNTVTIQNVTDASTVSPPGSLSGGPSNQGHQFRGSCQCGSPCHHSQAGKVTCLQTSGR